MAKELKSPLTRPEDWTFAKRSTLPTSCNEPAPVTVTVTVKSQTWFAARAQAATLLGASYEELELIQCPI